MIDNIFEIEKERDYTIFQIEQLCFLITTLFFSRKLICDRAAEIYKKPENITFPYNKDLLLDNFKTINKQNPELFTESGFGNLSNKMIVVNSASILEYYLRKIGKLFELNKDKIEPCQKCGCKKEPLPHSFDGIVKRFKDMIDITEIEGYEQSYLITLVRHKITHNRGNIDKSFKKNLKHFICKEAKLLCDKPEGSIIPISVDEFILPCLEKSIKFVKESSVRFISHIKKNEI